MIFQLEECGARVGQRVGRVDVVLDFCVSVGVVLHGVDVALLGCSYASHGVVELLLLVLFL